MRRGELLGGGKQNTCVEEEKMEEGLINEGEKVLFLFYELMKKDKTRYETGGQITETSHA